jgi:hypothetical protein
LWRRARAVISWRISPARHGGSDKPSKAAADLAYGRLGR